ncbi:glycosyltransferase 87 family protein [Rhodococcus sp. Z13]|uniref:Glycosyltransferase 87 family protein n=1 Tax=Rhodococcus sacchari TaxID=2962047 RepID=A0ACD4DG59_9NOCA|nr:glycosyltransferase 87 family protein [Rhodococcus sp. Z13]UYP19064.1 glycosyltransferase 87 family protein [Rhodococcus sp. Z13]
MRLSRQDSGGSTTTTSFFDSRAGTATAAITSLVAAGVVVAILLGSDLIDLLVYRLGARVLLDGKDLYGQMPPVLDDFTLPFTYPPLSAMLFVPLAVLPVALGKVVFTLVSLAALTVTLRLVITRVWPQLGPRASWTATTIAAAATVLLEPVRETISFGQINLVLMALVAVDVLTKNPKWPRGLLIGLAAAVKLTPAAFLLLFLVRRDRRTSLTIVASAVGFTALAFALKPSESVKYWLQTLPDTGRIGPAYFGTNESFKAVVARFAPPELMGSLLWLVAVAVMLLVAVIAIRRALDHGELVPALLANATAVLLASPVSWSHHWVWVAPALLVFAFELMRGPASRGALAVAAGVTVIFLVGPQHLLPSGKDVELDWALWQQALGALYVVVGVGFLVWLAFVRYQDGAVATRPDTPEDDSAQPLGSRP